MDIIVLKMPLAVKGAVMLSELPTRTATDGIRHPSAKLGVSLEIRSSLLGHKVRGAGSEPFGGEAMTSRYSHGGYGWNQELRRAVTLLETAYAGLNLSYGLSYEGPEGQANIEEKVANSREDQG